MAAVVVVMIFEGRAFVLRVEEFVATEQHHEDGTDEREDGDEPDGFEKVHLGATI